MVTGFTCLHGLNKVYKEYVQWCYRRGVMYGNDEMEGQDHKKMNGY